MVAARRPSTSLRFVTAVDRTLPARTIHYASLRYIGAVARFPRVAMASFCSLFDPRFRFAPPRTAGAKLFAPYTGRAYPLNKAAKDLGTVKLSAL